MGAEWSQRGGTIRASQLGDGFGGRALCLSSEDVPETPYEVAVRVRLDDESGAAGLVFASDGENVHYGFYPSGGKIRLTRFEGPDVYSWSILEEIDAPSYEPGDWNRLRVRVEAESISGWVNGEKLFTIPEAVLRGGRAGLCKFRRTKADFREFRVDRNLGSEELPTKERERIEETISRYLDGEPDGVLEELSQNTGPGRRLLLERAEKLDALARDLRSLEDDLHRQAVVNEVLMALDRPESEINLFEVGLQIARIDDPRIDLAHYRSAFSRLVGDADDYVKEKIGDEGSVRAEVTALRDFLFDESGFHGSRTEYYHHANSYVNRVLDDREGLPITLSVIFLEMARRIGIDDVYGAPLPGKFMVGVDAEAKAEKASKSEKESESEKKEADVEGPVVDTFYVDVFERGAILDPQPNRQAQDLTSELRRQAHGVLFRGHQLRAAQLSLAHQPGHQRDGQRLVIVQRLAVHQIRSEAPQRGKEFLRMTDPGKSHYSRPAPVHARLQWHHACTYVGRREKVAP